MFVHIPPHHCSFSKRDRSCQADFVSVFTTTVPSQREIVLVRPTLSVFSPPLFLLKDISFLSGRLCQCFHHHFSFSKRDRSCQADFVSVFTTTVPSQRHIVLVRPTLSVFSPPLFLLKERSFLSGRLCQCFHHHFSFSKRDRSCQADFVSVFTTTVPSQREIVLVRPTLSVFSPPLFLLKERSFLSGRLCQCFHHHCSFSKRDRSCQADFVSVFTTTFPSQRHIVLVRPTLSVFSPPLFLLKERSFLSGRLCQCFHHH